jgi:glutathione S-transferase
MRLFYSPTSPFVRKVLVVAHETGLRDRIETVRAVVSPQRPNRELAPFNPLMTVPTLVDDAETTLFGSQVICAYLDALHEGPRLIPESGAAHWRVMVHQALADGMLEAGLKLREDEHRRAETHDDAWASGQRLKVKQALDEIERRLNEFTCPLDLGQISVAVAIAWLVFRNMAGDIRASWPRLASWSDTIAERPSMRATVPRDDAFTLARK